MSECAASMWLIWYALGRRDLNNLPPQIFVTRARGNVSRRAVRASNTSATLLLIRIITYAAETCGDFMVKWPSFCSTMSLFDAQNSKRQEQTWKRFRRLNVQVHANKQIQSQKQTPPRYAIPKCNARFSSFFMLNPPHSSSTSTSFLCRICTGSSSPTSSSPPS